MSLPRYQPVAKRPKVELSRVSSLHNNNLDDYCLSKIIYYSLKLSSGENDEQDNVKTERNLSLVSKRWYLLTQAQINLCGVHQIKLDRIIRKRVSQTVKTIQSGIAFVPQARRRPGVLVPRNNQVQQPSFKIKSTSSTYDISLVRAIQPKLFKYKRIIIDGSLTCDEFRKLIIALNAARIEQLRLNVRIEKDSTQAKEFSVLPRNLLYLEKLTLLWTNDSKSSFSNALTWTIYERATSLRSLAILLEDSTDGNESSSQIEPIEKVSDKYMNKEYCADRSHCDKHPDLRLVTFKRTLADSGAQCIYTSLVHGILAHEDSVINLETNDLKLTDYIIRSTDRICTTLDFRLLKFLSPIINMQLLEQLFLSRTLGSDYLAVVVNDTDQLAELRKCLENFKPTRHENSICELSLHLKDQKVTDSEDRIKNIIQLNHFCHLTIHICAQQRVSIDCCHLMWSIGRALKADERCLFKIALQAVNTMKLNQTSANDTNYSEITIPFGQYRHFRINTSREDVVRHREIMKSLKRDCYHQFVKSVRDNM